MSWWINWEKSRLRPPQPCKLGFFLIRAATRCVLKISGDSKCGKNRSGPKLRIGDSKESAMSIDRRFGGISDVLRSAILLNQAKTDPVRNFGSAIQRNQRCRSISDSTQSGNKNWWSSSLLVSHWLDTRKMLSTWTFHVRRMGTVIISPYIPSNIYTATPSYKAYPFVKGGFAFRVLEP